MRKLEKVWDPWVRLGHWAMGALVLGAFLTSGEDEATPLHTRLGVALLGIVVFRVVWGVVGSKHARFADFVRSPREVLAYAKEYVRGRPGTHTGHNPLGGVMVVVMLVTLVVVTATGVVTYLGPEWGGPLAAMPEALADGIKEVHEATAWLLPALVVLHIAGVLLSSVAERQNLVLGMITGRKHAPEPAPRTARGFAARTAGFLAAVAIAAAVMLALLRLFPVNEAVAASPRPLLDAYATEARAEAPSFTPDAARGRTLYFTAREGTSCATCHTPDARQPGRSPVGKRIDALAPSANPERFTDRKKADRWFDRNCKQVLGRGCTAGEKADFVAYLVSL